MNNRKHLIFILYDSVLNSVFQSQVLTPLLNRLSKETSNVKENTNLKITLISFEKNKISKKQKPIIFSPVLEAIDNNKNFNFVQIPKIPFIGKLSLIIAIKKLKTFLKQTSIHEVIARGPFAGFIAQKALPKNIKLTVQARGLGAEELRFAHQYQKQSLFKRLIFKFRYNSIKKIEEYVYGHNSENFTIESVSPAMKKYLIKTFNAQPNKIVIATKDLPKPIDPKQILEWKHEIREKLNIPQNAYVYVYNGSYKPWQCPKETIEYFESEYKKNKNSYLLILSQNKTEFEKLISTYEIEKSRYTILSVPANQIFKYLSAADSGFLLRQPDIVNWTSRPTKMLEYQTVGLKIIHNNTIEYFHN